MRHDPARSTSGAPDPEGLRVDTPAYRLRSRWRLARQDRRSALVGRRHSALGVLMSAQRLSDVSGPACTPGRSAETARIALDVLWRTLHRDAARRTTHWNPGIAHLRQAEDLHRWGGTASWRDVAALLVTARRVAADEFDAARTGRRASTVRPTVAVPSS